MPGSRFQGWFDQQRCAGSGSSLVPAAPLGRITVDAESAVFAEG
jgi:hypothetical protein